MKRSEAFGAILERRGLLDELRDAAHVLIEETRQAAEVASAMVVRLPVSCDGCTSTKGCCRLTVLAFLHEAAVIADQLRREGRDTSALRSQLRTDADAMEQTHRHQYRRPCTFLNEDDRCSIYDVRPLACSSTFVFSSPFLCNDWNMNKARIRQFDVSWAQSKGWLIARAFFARIGMPHHDGRYAIGMLPRMVLVALEAWDRTDYRRLITEDAWALRAAAAIGEAPPSLAW